MSCLKMAAGHKNKSQTMRKTVLIILAATITLIATFTGVGYLWSQSGLHLGLHGWIAYGLGCFASIALSIGLFYLTFRSSRSGHDDLVSREFEGD